MTSHAYFFTLYRYLKFDPRPDDAPPPDKDKFLRGLQELNKPVHQLVGAKPTTSMWEWLLRFSYQEALSEDRRTVLQELVGQMFSRLEVELTPHLQDPLSNLAGVHVSGTEEQSESFLWHEIRTLRITGKHVFSGRSIYKGHR